MIYLSPHFDDAVLSCGGTIWEQAHTGLPVEIWTICAAGPGPDLPLSSFARELQDSQWKTGPEANQIRLKEDQAACARVGAVPRYFSIPDCIYRYVPGSEPGSIRPLISGEEDLFRLDLEPEEALVGALADELIGLVPQGETLVAPLTLGSHIDHRLVRKAAERASSQGRIELLYYADFPYVLKHQTELSALSSTDFSRMDGTISEPGLSAWQEAIAAYGSQIQTFWKSIAEMEDEIRHYRDLGGGRLWVRSAQSSTSRY